MTAIRPRAPTRQRRYGRQRAVGVLLAAVALLPACARDVGTGWAHKPNPASVHCEQHGGRVEIVEAADGSQRGVRVPRRFAV